MRIPVDKPYRITTQFGVADDYAKFGKHSGIDYAIELNREVKSPVDGVITYAQMHNTGGNMLMIKDSKGNQHRLMHNNSLVRKSGKVKQGEVVSRAGTTGLSTGVHVHHDIAKVQFPTSFSQFIDPNGYKDKEEDMYKGHNAKYWYDKYNSRGTVIQKLQQQLSNANTLRYAWRDKFRSVLDSLKSLINKEK